MNNDSGTLFLFFKSAFRLSVRLPKPTSQSSFER